MILHRPHSGGLFAIDGNLAHVTMMHRYHFTEHRRKHVDKGIVASDRCVVARVVRGADLYVSGEDLLHLIPAFLVHEPKIASFQLSYRLNVHQLFRV